MSLCVASEEICILFFKGALRASLLKGQYYFWTFQTCFIQDHTINQAISLYDRVIEAFPYFGE